MVEGGNSRQGERLGRSQYGTGLSAIPKSRGLHPAHLLTPVLTGSIGGNIKNI